MQHIALLCMGSPKESYDVQAMAEYQKRLQGLCRFELMELPVAPLGGKEPGEAQIRAALEKEAQSILKAVVPGDRMAALCVEGKGMDSEAFAAYLRRRAGEGGRTVFVIGSSHGLAGRVVQEAELKLSLSAMTLPHQMARLVLTEQIYRGLMINAGRRYHK